MMRPRIKATAFALTLVILPELSLAAPNSAPRCPPASSGTWPATGITGGTRRWKFRWQVAGEGIEVLDVRFNGRMVMKRGSLPFLPVQYEEQEDPQKYPNDEWGFNDKLTLQALARRPTPAPPPTELVGSAPFCCGSGVPKTVCDGPARDAGDSCRFHLEDVDLDECPTDFCDYVCVSTLKDDDADLENGAGERASDDPDADVVLTGAFQLGMYVFVQRWRFRDDGTIRPSVRLGGVHYCAQHTHQVYWKLNFQLVDAGKSPAETLQQCDTGACPETGNVDWSATLPCGCGFRPNNNTWWRVTDPGAPDRYIIIQSDPKEEDAARYCQVARNGAACQNKRDFCFLESLRTLKLHRDNDGLNATGTCPDLTQGGSATFWYFAHVNDHKPGDHLDACSRKNGEEAAGPTIRVIDLSGPPPCPFGDGLYCGNTVDGTIGLDPDILYRCTDGVYTQEFACRNGCQENTDRVNDACKADTCPEGDGRYCGSAVGLSSNVLYQCSSGIFTGIMSCASTCQDRPGATDRCPVLCAQDEEATVSSNNTATAATDRGSVDDSVDTFTSLGGSLAPLDWDDWYKVIGRDTFGSVLTAEGNLTGISDDLDVCIFWKCADGSTASLSCSAGTSKSEPGIGPGCCSAKTGTQAEFIRFSPNCASVNDTGTAYVHVFDPFKDTANVCRDYDVTIKF